MSTNEDRSESKDDQICRQERWGSFVTQLENDLLITDVGDENLNMSMPKKGGKLKTHSSLIFSLNGSDNGLDSNHHSALSAPEPLYQNLITSSECTKSHSLQSSLTDATPLTSMMLCDWIQAQKQITTSSSMKQYFEKSVQLLKSLIIDVVGVAHLAGISEIIVDIHPEHINSRNIRVVHSTLEGDSAHVIRQCYEREKISNDSVLNFEVMNALGKIAYELFMQGRAPPESNANDALKDVSTASSIPDIDASKSDIESVENDTLDMPRKNHRRSSENHNSGVIAIMLDNGVPYRLCQFVTDLILSNGYNDGLFCRDDSFQSFSDILSDLQQMLDMPDIFIHSPTTHRSSIAFGNKLYGRNIETQILLDVAARVVSKSSNDSIFDAFVTFFPKVKQQIIMITGRAGAGKTRLVVETSALLQHKGWLFLRGKFDRVNSEPLSIIADAFEYYFDFVINNSKQCSKDKVIDSNSGESLQRIRESLQATIEPTGLSILSRHVPSLLKIFDCNSNMDPSISSDVQVSKEQIHYLFGQLLQVLSTIERAILFFIDDLQWADAASLELFQALTKVIHHESFNCTVKNDFQILFIGAYRDNEVDENHLLTKFLCRFESDDSIEITHIAVSLFDQPTLNNMLSESLYVPIRKTRLLSEVILKKTDGVIIHIIEFIQRLIMDKALRYSFVSGWEWDINVIDMYPISKSVAELFTVKLQRLTGTVLQGVQILSCFGNKIDRRIINFIQDFDGDDSVDITSALLSAVSEGLVEMLESGQLFVFAHDIIQQSTFESILVDDRIELLRKLASTLIRNASAANDLESVIFLSVDLINCIGNDFVTNANERALYASLNEQAAKRALAVPDFSSAVRYSEAGISFLNEDHWDEQYDLSLSLYENSIAGHYSNADASQSLLQKRIDIIFSYARSFSDKFNSYLIWIKLLSTTSLQQAIDESHNVLELLYEPVDPSKIEINDVRTEFLRVKNNFPEQKRQFLSAAPIIDINKFRAMKLMSYLVIFYHAQRSVVGPYIACKMLELSLNFGICEYSSMAAAAFAAAIVNILDDVDEGCFWAKMALSLMSKSVNVNLVAPTIYAAVYGVVLVWKEPIQSTLEYLLYGCQSAFDSGSIQIAIANAKGYVSRAFFIGKDMNILLKEIESLAYKCFEEQALTPASIVLSVDDILKFGMQQKDLHIVHNQLTCDIFQSFLFKNIQRTERMVNLYYDIFDEKNQHIACTPINVLLEGLISYYYIRKRTKEDIWRSRAHKAYTMLEKWQSNHSKWNFRNKFLLLCAEHHRTEGEIVKSIQCYDESINCARKHKFWHEEALACELAGEFLAEQGKETKSKAMFEQSFMAYMKWGALRKANDLSLD